MLFSTARQTDRQTGRQASKQMRQTDTQMCTDIERERNVREGKRAKDQRNLVARLGVFKLAAT